MPRQTNSIITTLPIKTLRVTEGVLHQSELEKKAKEPSRVFPQVWRVGDDLIVAEGHYSLKLASQESDVVEVELHSQEAMGLPDDKYRQLTEDIVALAKKYQRKGIKSIYDVPVE